MHLSIEPEDALGVAMEKVAAGFIAKAEFIEARQSVGMRNHWIVGAEQNFALSRPGFHEANKFLGKPSRSVCRGIDVDVLMLAGYSDHFFGPRIAEVPTHDHQLRKVKGHLVDVGDRASGLRRAQRAGVTYLRAERHAAFDAFGEQRVVAAVGGWGVPEPGHHPQTHE